MKKCGQLALGIMAIALPSAACGGGFDARSQSERTTGDSAGQIGGADAGTNCMKGSHEADPTVPASLAAPLGTTLAARYHVEGNQVYVCTSTTFDVGGLGPGSTSYAWMLGFARATLDGACDAAASDLGPTWTSSDGSSVVAKTTAAVPAAEADAIPWTLSLAVSSAGSGVFENIAAIQRLETREGTAPPEPCGPENLHAERSVPFSATDYMYRR